MSCSRTQHIDAGEVLTHGPSVSIQVLYQSATALPKNQCGSLDQLASSFMFCLFDLMPYAPVNNFSIMSGSFLRWASTNSGGDK